MVKFICSSLILICLFTYAYLRCLFSLVIVSHSTRSRDGRGINAINSSMHLTNTVSAGGFYRPL